MKTTMITGALTAAALLGSPAMSATIGVLDITDGQTSCESTNLIDAVIACDVGTSNDLGNLGTDSVVNFAGSGVLGGFVADARGDNVNNFSDAALVNLAFDSVLTFTLINPDAIFDAEITFGSESAVLDANTTSFSFTSVAGAFDFAINSLVPTNNDIRNDTSWTLSVDAINVAAVPLPAGALLLLTGLGGLAAARRKRAA